MNPLLKDRKPHTKLGQLATIQDDSGDTLVRMVDTNGGGFNIDGWATIAVIERETGITRSTISQAISRGNLKVMGKHGRDRVVRWRDLRDALERGKKGGMLKKANNVLPWEQEPAQEDSLPFVQTEQPVQSLPSATADSVLDAHLQALRSMMEADPDELRRTMLITQLDRITTLL